MFARASSIFKINENYEVIEYLSLDDEIKYFKFYDNCNNCLVYTKNQKLINCQNGIIISTYDNSVFSQFEPIWFFCSQISNSESISIIYPDVLVKLKKNEAKYKINSFDVQLDRVIGSYYEIHLIFSDGNITRLLYCRDSQPFCNPLFEKSTDVVFYFSSDHYLTSSGVYRREDFDSKNGILKILYDKSFLCHEDQGISFISPGLIIPDVMNASIIMSKESIRDEYLILSKNGLFHLSGNQSRLILENSSDIILSADTNYDFSIAKRSSVKSARK